MTLETRRASLDDAGAMARLALELGYDCDEASMRRRLLAIRSEADHAIFVGALAGGMVVGFIHMELRRGLLSDPFVEIASFVVSSQHRRIGIGRALMERGHDWAEQHGIGHVRVRTQPHRKEAVAFYERLGYERVKEQRVLARVKVPDKAPPPAVTLDD
jgi:GNAT superfamily N-acetyltransferase